MHNARRTMSCLIATVITSALLSGCVPNSGSTDLSNLAGWLGKSVSVTSVTRSTEPNATDGEPDMQVVNVDLDDAVTAKQLARLLDALNAQLDGRPGVFENGLVRFTVQPEGNELSVETHAEAYPDQFATAAHLWFDLADHFETFSLEMPYVHSVGSSIERYVTVDLGAASWRAATEALRTLTALGAFDSDGDGGISSTGVTVGPTSVWWGDPFPAGLSFAVGEAPSESTLAAVDSLSDLSDAGVASFDFSGAMRAGGSLDVLAVFPADTAAVDSEFTEFEQSEAWTSATHVVDELAASGIPFSLKAKLAGDAERVFATLDSESCALTELPFSLQLTSYWRSIGGSC